jgi:hypothetical protein
MNKKGVGVKLLIGIVIAVLVFGSGLYFTVFADEQGPINVLRWFTPSFDKPGVEIPSGIPGLIKYELERSSVQYYRDVGFEDFVDAGQGKAVYVNGKALKEKETIDAFIKYFLAFENRVGGRDLLINEDSSDGVQVGNGRGFCLWIYDISGPRCKGGEYEVNLAVGGGAGQWIAPSIKVEIEKLEVNGDVIIQSNSVTSGVNPIQFSFPKMVLKTDDNLYFENGVMVKGDIDYYPRIASLAMSWRDSVLTKSIPLKVYDAEGNNIVGSCKIYESPVSKVPGINSKAFTLNADLSKSTIKGDC